MAQALALKDALKTRPPLHSLIGLPFRRTFIRLGAELVIVDTLLGDNIPRSLSASLRPICMPGLCFPD